MSSERYDANLPEVLPTTQDLLNVFGLSLSWRSHDALVDPDVRLEVMRSTFLGKYPTLTHYLHHRVVDRRFIKGVESGRSSDRSYGEPDLRTRTHGLHSFKDIEPYVVPSMQGLFNGIYQSELTTDEKLGRMAAITGVVTAESQALLDGNHRVARAMYDYIRFGGEGFRAENVFDDRSFLPPEEIEELILMQNLARVFEETDEKTIYQPYPGMYVSGDVKDSFAEATDFLNRQLNIEETSNVTPFGTKEYRDVLRRTRLREKLEAMLSVNDPKEQYFIAMGLQQRKYGAAAWAATFRDGMPGLPLSEKEARLFYEQNLQLLRMRVISLATGMAAGGTFIQFDEIKPFGNWDPTPVPWAPDWMR